MCCLTFSKRTVQQCSVAMLIIRSKFYSDVLKENYCLIKVYFVPDQFSVNGFILFCFVLFVCLFLWVFFNPLPTSDNLGKTSNMWLEYTVSKNNIHIQHALNDGER